MRDRFVTLTHAALDRDPKVALVLADISVSAFETARSRHPDRVINVGIREQLMLGVAGGLAIEGMRPIAHSYAPFLVERAYEQLKVALGHQGVGAILASVGASYDWAAGGRTHHAPADVVLLDALPGWHVQVPGHPDEVAPLFSDALVRDESVYLRLSTRQNEAPRQIVAGRSSVVRRGRRGTVIAVGPMLDPTLAAIQGLDLTVLYATTVRPFDAATLRDTMPSATHGSHDIALVEPTVEGTSSHVVSAALVDRPHRLLAIGVPRVELRRYGTPEDHDRAYGLDARGLAERLTPFFR
ncbi:MAG: transketolase [Polyangiaceae bacterium]|jgi:transketolase|nr:transketolase [Polyangiaceae bacterium]